MLSKKKVIELLNLGALVAKTGTLGEYRIALYFRGTKFSRLPESNFFVE